MAMSNSLIAVTTISNMRKRNMFFEKYYGELVDVVMETKLDILNI